MKKVILVVICALFSLNLFSHKGGHGTPLKVWELTNEKTTLKADFIKLEKDKVLLSDENHKILEFSISDFSDRDKNYILNRHKTAAALNYKKSDYVFQSIFPDIRGLLPFAGGIFLLIFISFQLKNQTSKRYWAYGFAIAVIVLQIACDKDEKPSGEPGGIPANDISFMKSVFETFSGVSSSSDDTYFYVASDGLPNHNMMVGITNWQQQVPIDHNYSGNNSWAIPIKPELADNPLSTQTNLLKGAIAVAVNGIPIFNPLNNRGEDANAIGELDQWGGHCGRADDYHYHLPPIHLQATVGASNPIAYAVDGFPVYGETTDPLDEYLGKFNSDGSYQYHTVSEYPYFIAGMRGEVTLDPNTSAPENQVIPQAMTKGVRPALSPLLGAVITNFQSTGTNSYTLTYSLNSEQYRINYNWNDTGLYSYEFVKPDGTNTVETYQR